MVHARPEKSRKFGPPSPNACAARPAVSQDSSLSLKLADSGRQGCLRAVTAPTRALDNPFGETYTLVNDQTAC